MYPIYVGASDAEARREVIEHWHRWRRFALAALNLAPDNPVYQRVFGHLDYDAMVRDNRGVFGAPTLAYAFSSRSSLSWVPRTSD